MVTIGQIIGMAAHLDGLASSILDVTGLAQKYGAVMSHVRVATDAGALHATRIAAGEADAIIGCDLVVTAGDEALSRTRAGRTRVALSTDLTPTGEFARNPDWQADPAALLRRIEERCGAAAVDTIESHAHRRRRCWAIRSRPTCSCWASPGSTAGSRCRGAAIERAIELNGVQVEFNRDVLPVGPPRRARSRGGREALGAGRERGELLAARNGGADRRDARRIPHRVPRRGVRASATGRWSTRVDGGRARRGLRRPAVARGRALPFQAARDQGRMGSRAPLRGGGFPARAGGDLRRRLHAAFPSGRVALRPHRSDHRACRSRARPARGC